MWPRRRVGLEFIMSPPRDPRLCLSLPEGTGADVYALTLEPEYLSWANLVRKPDDGEGPQYSS
jgi:hypothetical protein